MPKQFLWGKKKDNKSRLTGDLLETPTAVESGCQLRVELSLRVKSDCKSKVWHYGSGGGRERLSPGEQAGGWLSLQIGGMTSGNQVVLLLLDSWEFSARQSLDTHHLVRR